MRFFFDCEFIEDGSTIELISIGIVAEDGREYYAIRSDAPWKRIRAHSWLMSNVVPHLPGQFGKPSPGGFGELKWRVDKRDPRVKPRQVIANEVREFLLADGEPVELWADYGAYDHVVLAQLYGPMINLPAGLPMFTCDVQQEIRRLSRHKVDALPKQATGVHDALADARHVRDLWRAAVEAQLATGGLYPGTSKLTWQPEAKLLGKCVDEPGPEVTDLPPGDTVRRDDQT